MRLSRQQIINLLSRLIPLTVYILAIIVNTGLSVHAEGLLGKFLKTKAEPKLAVVFVDVSQSTRIEDWNLYKATYEKVVEELKPGDRFIFGTISDKPVSRFVSVADEELPNTGVELDDNEAADKIKQKLNTIFENVRSGGRSPKTYILDTLNTCQNLIESDTTRKTRWIIILSDMIEDSNRYNFDKINLTDDAIQKIIEQKKKEKLLPDLHGAHVYVVGAGGTDAKKYSQVRNFWMRYFKEAQAVSDMYGRAIPQFSNSR